MKMKLRAALGSLLVSAAVAGVVVVPASAGAHGATGPLCYGNVPGGAPMTGSGGALWGYLAYGEAFRILNTIVVSGTFVSYGHSASSSPNDYAVWTDQLRCQ